MAGSIMVKFTKPGRLIAQTSYLGRFKPLKIFGKSSKRIVKVYRRILDLAHCEDGVEVGAGGGKFSPRCSSCTTGTSERLTLASCEVEKGAWSVWCAPWDLTASGGVPTPVSSQPTGSVAPTGHPELDSGLLYLFLGSRARGKQWRGTS